MTVSRNGATDDVFSCRSIRMKSCAIPPPKRTAVLPSPAGSQAIPIRLMKLSQLARQEIGDDRARTQHRGCASRNSKKWIQIRQTRKNHHAGRPRVGPRIQETTIEAAAKRQLMGSADEGHVVVHP